jgi:hypothetical protein
MPIESQSPSSLYNPHVHPEHMRPDTHSLDINPTLGLYKHAIAYQTLPDNFIRIQDLKKPCARGCQAHRMGDNLPCYHVARACPTTDRHQQNHQALWLWFEDPSCPGCHYGTPSSLAYCPFSKTHVGPDPMTTPALPGPLQQLQGMVSCSCTCARPPGAMVLSGG